MSYRLVATYPGHDSDFDLKLEKLIRRECSGTGFNLMDGMRDVSWIFNKKDAALKASQTLRAHRRRGMSVKVWNDDRD